MPLEPRTRIILILPAPTARQELKLVNKTLSYLLKLSGGLTATSSIPSSFDGWWLNPRTGKLEQEPTLLIIADVPRRLSDPKLLLALDKLKLRCQKDFFQKIIWLTLHEIQRVNTDDNVRK